LLSLTVVLYLLLSVLLMCLTLPLHAACR
jgi:hypothetical protein